MKKLLVFVFCMMSAAIFAADLEGFVEEHMVQPQSFYNFQEKGFGFYDQGDETLKVFDWNFSPLFSFPIKKGQGPGQLKRGMAPTDIVMDDTHVYAAMSFENIINVYEKNGKFVKEIKSEMAPQMMVKLEDTLVIYNGSLSFEDETTELNCTYNLKSKTFGTPFSVKGLQRDKNKLSEDLGEIQVSGIHARYASGNDGHIVLLDRQKGRLFVLDSKGTVSKEVALPAVEAFKMHKEQKGNQLMVSLRATSYFSSVLQDGKDILVAFNKDLLDDEKTTTQIFRIKYDGSVNKKEIKGRWQVVGVVNGELLIFDREEYELKTITF